MSAAQNIVVPLNWVPQHQPISTAPVSQATPAQITADTLTVINTAVNGGSANARQIITMPIQRGLLVKQGYTNIVNPPVGHSKVRPYNEAAVGYCFGQEAPVQCSRCQNGNGCAPYCITVTLPNGTQLWQGACMGCRVQERDWECSINNNGGVRPANLRARRGRGGGTAGTGAGRGAATGGTSAGMAGSGAGRGAATGGRGASMATRGIGRGGRGASMGIAGTMNGGTNTNTQNNQPLPSTPSSLAPVASLAQSQLDLDDDRQTPSRLISPSPDPSDADIDMRDENDDDRQTPSRPITPSPLPSPNDS